MRIIYTKIVADLFHVGHVNFLREASLRGDKLVIHVVDDARVTNYKGKPVMSQSERIAVVSSCKYVDEVLESGPKVITKSFMDENGYSAYAFGYSNESEKAAKFADCSDLPPEMIEIVDYTNNISTSDLKRRVLDNNKVPRYAFSKKLVFYLALALLIGVGTLGVDLIVGIFTSTSNNTDLISNNGIHFEPNSTTFLETDEFSYTINANQYGLRSPEVSLLKPDSVFRILVIGDSWTMGYGVADHEAWPQVLQNNFIKEGIQNVQIINAARSGLGPSQYLSTLEKTIELFNPDLVLVGLLQINDLTDVLLNDNLDVVSGYRTTVYSEIVSLLKRFYPNTIELIKQWKPVHRSVDLRSNWKNTSLSIINSLDAVEKIRYGLLPIDVIKRFESGNLNPQLLRLYIFFPERPFIFNETSNHITKKLFQKQTEIITKMKTLSKQNASEFAVVHLPMNFYTGHEVIRNTFDQVLPFLVSKNNVDSILSMELANAQIKHVILTKVFSETTLSEPLFYPYDGHPTSAGQSLIASEVFLWEYLQELVFNQNQ